MSIQINKGAEAVLGRRFFVIVSIGVIVAQLQVAASVPAGADTGSRGLADATATSKLDPSGDPLQVQWTRTGNIFQLADGSYQASLVAGSINYRAPDAGFADIDSMLYPVAGAGDPVENAANRFRADLPKALEDGIKISRAGITVVMSLAGANGIRDTAGPSASYGEVLPGVRLSYIAQADALKEALILEGPGSQSEFAFHIDLPDGVTVKENSAGGADIVTSEGRLWGEIPTPYMVDGISSPEESEGAVALSVGPDAGGYLVTLTPDETWLSAPERDWPVTLDPSIAYPTLTQDCYLNESDPTHTFCSTGGINVGHNQNGTRRGLLKFDFFGIPSSAQVSSADLTMHLTAQSQTRANPVEVRRMLRDWTNAATWNTSDGAALWTTPGGNGDYSSTIEATNANVGLSGLIAYSWPLTSLTQSWLAETADNYGLMLRATDESIGNVFTFASSEATDAALRPTLTINYTVPTLIDEGEVPADAISGPGIFDMTNPPAPPASETYEASEPSPTPNFGPGPSSSGPGISDAVQNEGGAASLGIISNHSYAGLNEDDNPAPGILPPDPQIAITHSGEIAEVVNAYVRLRDRGNNPLTPFSGMSLKYLFSPSSSGLNPGDSRAIYDPVTRRVIVVAIANVPPGVDSTREAYLLIAISPYNTVEGDWCTYRMNANRAPSEPSGYYFPRRSIDYPLVGVYSDAVVVTAKMLATEKQAWEKLYWFPIGHLTDCVAAADLHARQTSRLAVDSRYAITIAPAVSFETGNNPGWMISADFTGSPSYITLWKISGVCCGDISPHKIKLQGSYQDSPDAPEQGGPDLDSGAFQINQGPVVSASHYMYAAQACDCGAGTAQVRVYRLNVSTLCGEDLFPDPSCWTRSFSGGGTYSLFNPAVGVDGNDTKVLTYSRTSASTTPVMVYRTKAGDDAWSAGTVLHSSSRAATGSTRSRWGDIAGAAADPDGRGVWIVNEYFPPSTTNLWATWFAEVG